MKNSIEISNKSIKLSYRRFISDTAIGLLTIAIILFLFHDSNNIFFKNSSIADKIFVYTLIFILTTPLGLLVNISSWILFGFFQYFLSKDIVLKLEKLSLIGKFIFYSTNEKYQIQDIKNIFLLNKTNFYRIVKKIETFLDIFMPDSISYKENLIGMRIFYRNISFILFIISITLIYKMYNLKIIVITFSLSLFFLIANSIVNVYYIFFLLRRFYYLYLADNYGTQIKKITEDEIDQFISKVLNYYYKKKIT